MREDRSRTTRKHCCHQVPLGVKERMSNGIGPLMHAVQPPGHNPLIDDLDVKSQLLQLPERHNSVLPSSQVGDGSVGSTPPPTGRFPSV